MFTIYIYIGIVDYQEFNNSIIFGHLWTSLYIFVQWANHFAGRQRAMNRFNKAVSQQGLSTAEVGKILKLMDFWDRFDSIASWHWTMRLKKDEKGDCPIQDTLW